jgi:hypothetical protein
LFDKRTTLIHFDPGLGIGTVHSKVSITAVTLFTIDLIPGTKAGAGEIAAAGTKEIRRHTGILPFPLNGKELFSQVKHYPPVS